MKVIGLVGGIGSGKSTVIAQMNEIMPINSICADVIGHEILKKENRGYAPVLTAFGEDILDETGEISRKKLAAKVFGHPERLVLLNHITHPLITQVIEEKIETFKNQQPNKHITLEAALLVESGLTRLTDVIIAVYANVDLRIKRVVERDKVDIKQVKARIDAQKDWEELKKAADYIIDTGISPQETKRQIQEILSLL